MASSTGNRYRSLIRAAHDLPLSDRIHGIAVVDAFLSPPVARVDGIHPQVSGGALRVGPTPLPNRDAPDRPQSAIPNPPACISSGTVAALRRTLESLRRPDIFGSNVCSAAGSVP
jgi:hypothetical protein